MAKVLLPDELWSLIAVHLPVRAPFPKGGRPRIGDSAALTGILFVLGTGLPREYLLLLATGSTMFLLLGTGIGMGLPTAVRCGAWKPWCDGYIQSAA